MLDETFAEAVAHKRANWLGRIRGFSGHKILGIRLRPFSFWHAAYLDFIKSPFAGHVRPAPLSGAGVQTKPDLGDLILAIACCRARYPNPPSFTGLRWRLLRWRAKLCYSIRVRRLRHAPLMAEGLETLAFYRYLKDYSSVPTYGESEDSQPVKTPWYLFAVALQLRLNPRLTVAQAWNSSIGLAGWMNAAHIEASGTKIDILTPELREAFGQIGVKV